MSTDRTKSIEAAISNIQRQFGQGAIMRFTADSVDRNVEVIPTGSLTLDIALGIGGLPRGRIVEIYGPEASGKTTLTLHAIAECQKAGGVAAFIDAEHAVVTGEYGLVYQSRDAGQSNSRRCPISRAARACRRVSPPLSGCYRRRSRRFAARCR